MSDATPRSIRTSADIGYGTWLLHRLSAVLLVGLLAIHVAVQVYPGSVLDQVLVWGIYGRLLDLTLAVVLLHGFIGVYATIRESSLGARWKQLITLTVGVVFLALFAVRILG